MEYERIDTLQIINRCIFLGDKGLREISGFGGRQLRHTKSVLNPSYFQAMSMLGYEKAHTLQRDHQYFESNWITSDFPVIQKRFQDIVQIISSFRKN